MAWKLYAPVWVLLGLATAAPLRAESPTAREVIRDCSQRAKSDLVGLDALRAACPALPQALEDLGLTAHLPRDWQEDVTAGDLADWSALADRYHGSSIPVPLPDSSRLQTIAGILRPPPESPNWWERFKTWVASWIDPERGRWPDWLQWPSHWQPGKPALYGMMGLVLIAAAVVIVMELRAARVFGAGRRHRSGPATVTPTHSLRSAEREEIDEPIEQLRPERLLRVLVVALTKSHRLERDRDLTCRELITAARFDTEAQREIFASVALRAEQILYGDPHRAPTLNDGKLGQSAQGLYGQLLAADAGRPPK